MAQKTIQLIKPYGLNVKGAVLSLDAPIADLLIQRGRAEAVPARKAVKLQPWVKK